jgi:AraC-like DNA-binding protein
MTELIKLDTIEEVEILTMVGQKQSFPNHYHKDFCISLITEGIECMKVGERYIYSEKDYVSITNPNEIHSNPLVPTEKKLCFHTVYIPENLMTEISGAKHVYFEKRSFKDLQLKAHILELIRAVKENKNETEPQLLGKIIIRLAKHSTDKITDDKLIFKASWEKVLLYIDDNLKNDISLSLLSLNFGMDKFKFAKAFKYLCGMSPMNYVLMKRIFKAKGMISKNTNLTALAYEYNFTDMAHFSKQFKRFIGLSPRQFQKGIIQD